MPGVSSIDVIDGEFVSGLTNGECSDVFVEVLHELARFSCSQGVEGPKSTKSGGGISFFSRTYSVQGELNGGIGVGKNQAGLAFVPNVRMLNDSRELLIVDVFKEAEVGFGNWAF